MLNPRLFENAPPEGHPVVEVIAPKREESTARSFLPLRRTLIRGTVTGPLAELETEHEFGFGADSGTPAAEAVLEARYRFPLPGNAAILAVTVRFGNVEIEATLAAREVAEAAYAEARAEGRQAALATRETADVFTLQLSGLKAGEPVLVTTRFVLLARSEAQGWSVRLPLTTAPRFVREDERETPAGQANPFAVWRDPGHRAAIDLTVAGAAEISSPTHALTLEAGEEPDSWRVRLQDGDVLPDRDLLLHLQPAQDATVPHLQLWSAYRNGDDESYLLAQIAPPAKPASRIPREIILLVDHSGSMTGPKWEAADWAVERLLRDLQPDDRFALAAFESSTWWFRQEVVPASAQEVDSAVRWLRTNTRSGGTNLGVALEQALQLPRSEDSSSSRARHLLIVTDAEVSDSGRILALADRELQQSRELRRRISVLCIDAAPNEFLATELAERGGGFSHFLTSDPGAEDITTALDSLLNDFAAPVLHNARFEVNRQIIHGALSVGEAQGTDASALDLGDLVAGRVRWVVARVPRSDAPLEARLVTDTAIHATAAPDEAVANPPRFAAAVRALFGARRINALETLSTSGEQNNVVAGTLARMGYGMTEEGAGTGPVYAENRLQASAALVKPLLLAESLRYGLASTAVGFVATRKEAGKPVNQQVDVANALPAGWSGRFASRGLPTLASAPARAATIAQEILPMGAFAADTGPMMLFQRAKSVGQSLQSKSTVASRAPGEQSAILYSGAPAAGETVLFDSSRPEGTALPERVTLTALVLESADKTITGTLLLFVGDLAQPRARVELADLVRLGRRPLNLRRRGDVVRLVLNAPHSLPRLVLRLVWS